MVCVFIQGYILTVYYLIIIPMLVPVEELGGTVNQPREFCGTNGEVLYTHDGSAADAYHLVHQLHWIAVWQQLAYAVHVEYRLLVRVIDRSLYLVFAYFLTHQSCKLVVDGVSGA